MRLIDADAEIARIDKEIEKYEARILYLQIKKNEEPENNYNDWDEKIKQYERDILDCKKEIRMLRSYQTAYDPDKVVDTVREDCYQMGFDESQTEIIVEDVKGGGME